MILSIDIGLRNLSLCIMSAGNKADMKTYKIHLWDVYNTLDSDDYKCKSLQKNKKTCNRKCSCKYKDNDDTIVYSCKSHFPKQLLPLKKDNIFKKKAVNDYLLQDIAIVVLSKIQEIYDNNIIVFSELKNIIIELQPKINQKMKFTSHIIYGKLVELYKETNTTVRFVRASQKLKAYTGPSIECKLKGSYAKRKWLSIQYTKWFLENKFDLEQSNTWLPFFENHSKKDDVSDTMLMAINGLYGIPKKQRQDKNGKCIK